MVLLWDAINLISNEGILVDLLTGSGFPPEPRSAGHRKHSDVIKTATCILDLGQGPAGSWKVIFGIRALGAGR